MGNQGMIFLGKTKADASGREVRTLVDEILEAGLHEADFRAAGLPSGIYAVRIRAAGFVAMRKMVLSR
jgi:hypothetical protein